MKNKKRELDRLVGWVLGINNIMKEKRRVSETERVVGEKERSMCNGVDGGGYQGVGGEQLS